MSNTERFQCNVNEAINRFFDDSSIPAEGPPEFVLFMGMPGSGKSTIRRQKYSKGHVVVDAGEIYADLIRDKFYEFGDLGELIELLGALIAERAVAERRNVVTEMTGRNREAMETLNDAMKSAGYRTKLVSISCEMDEAMRRHKKAVAEDPSYISCYFTEKSHEQWLIDAVKSWKSSSKLRVVHGGAHGSDNQNNEQHLDVIEGGNRRPGAFIGSIAFHAFLHFLNCVGYNVEDILSADTTGAPPMQMGMSDDEFFELYLIFLDAEQPAPASGELYWIEVAKLFGGIGALQGYAPAGVHNFIERKLALDFEGKKMFFSTMAGYINAKRPGTFKEV